MSLGYAGQSVKNTCSRIVRLRVRSRRASQRHEQNLSDTKRYNMVGYWRTPGSGSQVISWHWPRDHAFIWGPSLEGSKELIPPQRFTFHSNWRFTSSRTDTLTYPILRLSTLTLIDSRLKSASIYTSPDPLETEPKRLWTILCTTPLIRRSTGE